MATKAKKFNRVCALKSCGKEFSTNDERKVYHSRACGNAARSNRWYKAAAAAKRKLDGKKGAKHVITAPVNAHGKAKSKAKVVKKSKPKPKVKAKRRAAKPKVKVSQRPVAFGEMRQESAV